jgi:hypothetical protein
MRALAGTALPGQFNMLIPLADPLFFSPEPCHAEELVSFYLGILLPAEITR